MSKAPGSYAVVPATAPNRSPDATPRSRSVLQVTGARLPEVTISWARVPAVVGSITSTPPLDAIVGKPAGTLAGVTVS